MSYQTFEVTETGAMLPVTAVYMTDYERQQWEGRFEVVGDTVTSAAPLTFKEAANRVHNKHAEKYEGFYRNGNTKVSKELIERAVIALNGSRTIENAARKLGVAKSTMYSYRAIAKREGVL